MLIIVIIIVVSLMLYLIYDYLSIYKERDELLEKTRKLSIINKVITQENNILKEKLKKSSEFQDFLGKLIYKLLLKQRKK